MIGRRSKPLSRSSTYCDQRDRFAELAIADDVDADLGLLAHDFGDRIRQALRVSRLVIRLSSLLGAQEFLQRRRPNETSNMRGQDAITAALHWSPRATPSQN